MTPYTQAGRPFRAYTALDPDMLLLETFSGVEAVSRPFEFTLELLSEKPDIDPDALLRQPIVVVVNLPDGEERFFHGIVNRFLQLDQKEHLTSYRAEVVPWLWFLALSKDCRIFQEKSVLEIVEEVFRDLGCEDFRFRVTRNYPKREYCVQYRETHLEFISRLLEEEGLFYFFEHTRDKHTLVVTDSNSAFDTCPGAARARISRQGLRDEDVVLGLWREHAVHPGRMTLGDYDYLQPSLALEAWTDGEGDEETYDFPGKYTTRDEGAWYTRLRMEGVEALRHTVKGTSSCRGFMSGGRFELEDHYRREVNQEYVLLQVQHYASDGGYRSGMSGGSTEYRNEFLAIPSRVTYRPIAVTEKPVVQGSQTALVVGPEGEEVFVDRHGRIKVQFHWDRYGQRNEDSSCWIRVASPWAGKGWGAVAIPRIGNEVLVHFIEGDPDRPIVVASVYNAEQTPPFELPDAGIQMGMKSRSSKGGGGFNEITLTDTKGRELINVRAQRDMATTVLRDQSDRVRNNRTTTVDVDDSETVGSNQTIQVGADQSVTVGGDQSIEVGGDRRLVVGGDQQVQVGGNHELTAGAEISLASSAATTIEAGSTALLKANTSGKIDAGTTLEIVAGASIKLSAGGSTIEIGPSGITINGTAQVKINAGGIVEVKGAVVKVN